MYLRLLNCDCLLFHLFLLIISIVVDRVKICKCSSKPPTQRMLVGFTNSVSVSEGCCDPRKE